MKKIEDYLIVTETKPQTLTDKVREWISKGYQPYGEPFYFMHETRDLLHTSEIERLVSNAYTFCQAMVSKAKTN